MLSLNLVKDLYVGMAAGYNIRLWHEMQIEKWTIRGIFPPLRPVYRIYGGKYLRLREKSFTEK